MATTVIMGGLEELILSNAMHNGHASLQSDVHNASVNNMQETSDAARDTVDAVRDSIAATNNIGNLNLSATERNGGETRLAAEQAAGTIRDQMSFNANQQSRDHARIISEICDVRKEMSDGFGDTQLEMCKQHGEIKLEMCKQHGEIERRLSEHHCEIKQLVQMENAQTRQLLQSNELDAANRRAHDAQRENDLLRLQASVNVG